MKANLSLWSVGLGLLLSSAFLVVGCYHAPVDVSEFSQGPAPLRMPSPASQADSCGYEDSLTGGKIFKMYCAYCHDVRPLSERPFADYRNVAQHMRLVANLTGKEYAKLMEFLRRWHDVPPPEQREAPSPKRFFFSQPIPELRQDQAKTAPDLVGGPRPGSNSELSPAQPPPGNSPQEAR
ncbi:MAG TPA: hypothetical protein VEL76_15670 [Gemmataceae bacterium]|nr:hypothetical protein [Gemmataceae bacterium]